MISGSKTIAGSLKYLLPISYPETGTGYGFLFFDRIGAELFFDEGGATYGAISDILWKRSYGLEFGVQTMNTWGLLSVVINLGYVKGIDPLGEEQIYFNFSL